MTNPTTLEKKRSPVAAFFLNLVFYPAGYVYVGKAKLGLAIYVACILAAFAIAFISMKFPPGFYALVTNLPLTYGVLFLVSAGLSLPAAILARTSRPTLRGVRFWLAIIGLPLACYAIAFLGKGWWPFPDYSIPSLSGVPTILKGDIVLAQGSKTNCGAINPKLGDMVIYNRGATSYIKRLVGMPGDRVQFNRGVLILNGQPVQQKIESQTNLDLGGFLTKADVVRETMSNGKSYRIALVDRSQPPENTQPLTLGPDQYFFVGDNRDNSLDSRFDGPTTKDKLCAVAIEIVYSPDHTHIGQRP